ncbi:BON domain-containing protein [Dactylosporangium sp. NPDC049140]|uniref:BON domain-containing protein n=1 Tax=Dactylosporangium sp. NPDC049140 TaxID=3155647 RepID=UPI0033EEFC5F
MTQTMRKTDQELKTAVTEELHYTPNVDASGVEVQVDGGTVTLSGEVNSLPERLAAKHAAMRVGGVTNVTNKTAVRALLPTEINDQTLAHAVGEALAWTVDVPANAVKADVRDQRVTLTGRVTWDYQRHAATRAVTYLKGVKLVSNEILLESAVPTAGTKAAAEAAIRRSAELNPANITIGLDGSELTLHGSVGSWSQLRAAERAAWSAAGVTSVRNELHIAS